MGGSFMIIKSAGMTHIGKVRLKNEDNFYINKMYREDVGENIKAAEDQVIRNHYTYAVCDGMGGESYGEMASLDALKVLREYDNQNIRENIYQYINVANEAVCSISNSRRVGTTGTTLAMFVSDGITADLLNIGDSRIYIFRNGLLEKCSKDHTQAQDLIDAGVMSEADARKSKQSHILTQHLGIPEDEFIVEPHICSNVKLVKDDIFLLCSDGLTDMITISDIREIIKVNCEKTPKDIVSRLIKCALDNGGKDNVTAIIVKVS